MKRGEMNLAIVLVAILLIGAVSFVYYKNSFPNTEENAAASGNQENLEDAISELAPEIPEPKIQTKEFAIETDDYGFYINGDGVPSISVNSGDETKITFNVKTQNVYYGGLDFRGCGQNAGKINPGSSTIVEFTASENCMITSYWPLSGVVKTNLKILVN